ncbi:MAG: hypothetical protein M1514_03985 [Patescibacteria group bacterium]|nr:hypothetical protein [Patescibacteria group bacterium]
MKNANLLDQFFLNDPKIVGEFVKAASLKKTDRVLEIGAGTGILTRELAKKAGKIVALEIDKTFKNELSKMPGNVEVIFINALVYLNKPAKFNKIVGSLPSSVVEPFFQKLTKLHFNLGVFIVPLKFVKKLLTDPSLSFYLNAKLISKVGKGSFIPIPKTNWALIKVTLQEFLKDNNNLSFINQYLIEHPEAKLKNALMEAVVKVKKKQGQKITKNEARIIVSQFKLPGSTLEEKVILQDLFLLSKKLQIFFKQKPPKKIRGV